MKKVFVILLVSIFSLMFAGCLEDKANTEKERELTIPEKDLPFTLGDIVLLKPDGHEAVITEIARSPRGVYKVKYDSTGQNFKRLEFIKITHLCYTVRYVVRQEHPESHISRPDPPTKILHYQKRDVHWYEIQEKKS